MKLFFKRAYSKIGGFALSKKNKLFTDIVLLLASGYLLVKKVFTFSISGWLLQNYLNQGGVNLYIYISGGLLITALCLKFVAVIFEAFPPSKHLSVEPDEITACLQNMNNEISAHLAKCETEQPFVNRLSEQHSFDINLRLITESLVEHVKKSLNGIKIKKRDLFVSLYALNEESQTLEYLLHFDQKRDLVRTKSIPLNGDAFEKYESVKCLLSNSTACVVLEKRHYEKGLPKRYKTLQHYIGLKLELNGATFGFLNIEFHNNPLFTDEDTMTEFMEENIFPFKLLFEYQFLKRDFFKQFEEFNNNWRVT